MQETTQMQPTKQRSRTVIILTISLVTIVAFSLGFFIGGERGERSVVPAGEGVVTSQGAIARQLEDDVDFKQFWNVWNFIKDSYHSQPVSDKELYFGAMKGLVAGLKDPYSIYFSPDEASAFISNLEGSFQGIGAEIGIKDEKLQIVAPLDDSPAQRAGVRPGDWIVLIDELKTIGMTVEEAVTHIRGEKGTEVVLTVSREGNDELTEIPITRDKIVINSVKWEIDENNFMLISMSTFNDDTVPLFNEAIQDALTKQVDGIILDLRSNPGGLLTAAIDVAAAWAGYQPVVIERAQEKALSFKGLTAPRLEDIPTVVLVNGGSASGSEIVAGALQDYGFATIVGTQTFGKGSVQDYRELPDGAAVKITTALWYTPEGRSIHETGIEPDIKVNFTIEQYEDGLDPQKDTAIEVLLGTYQPEPSDIEAEE